MNTLLANRIVEAGGMPLYYAAIADEPTVLTHCHHTGLQLWVDGRTQYIVSRDGEILAKANVTTSLMDIFANVQLKALKINSIELDDDGIPL
jgi:hypothetical protein